MEKRKTINELCNALGISVSVSSLPWDSSSIELAITIPMDRIYTMHTEDYIYAALLGIYQYKKKSIETKEEILQTDPPKKVSRLANLLKRHK